jgi:hypothetical protein
MWKISENGKELRIKLRYLTHATSNLGIWFNGKISLYLEDLANPKIGLNLVPNPLLPERYQQLTSILSTNKYMRQLILIA